MRSGFVNITGNRGSERGGEPYVDEAYTGSSTVREALPVGFPGGTYTGLFYVADAEPGTALAGFINILYSLVRNPLSGPGRGYIRASARAGIARSA
jgi:hypothetical protein